MGKGNWGRREKKGDGEGVLIFKEKEKSLKKSGFWDYTKAVFACFIGKARQIAMDIKM